MNLYWICK